MFTRVASLQSLEGAGADDNYKVKFTIHYP